MHSIRKIWSNRSPSLYSPTTISHRFGWTLLRPALRHWVSIREKGVPRSLLLYYWVLHLQASSPLSYFLLAYFISNTLLPSSIFFHSAFSLTSVVTCAKEVNSARHYNTVVLTELPGHQAMPAVDGHSSSQVTLGCLWRTGYRY